jgi:hypothetical protein
MSKPNEIAVVTALGQKYDIWNTVEVTREYSQTIDHALLTVSEISTGAKNFAAMKLKPGDPATITLAGETAIDGYVYLRQSSYDAKEHGVQIGICSNSQAIMASTVDANPGQYINQTLQQIGSAVFGKVGVNFSVIAEASEPFPRVSEHVGETRFAFIERLGRMRNIHLIDDGQGGIIGFRGPFINGGSLWMHHVGELVTVNSPMLLPEDSMDFLIKGVVHRQSSEQGTTADVLLCRFDGLGSGSGEPLRMTTFGSAFLPSGAMLQEGRNILRARLLLKIDDLGDPLTSVGMDASNDDADSNRATSGEARVESPLPPRPVKFPAEEMGSNSAMQKRADHEADWTKYQLVDGDVTVPGWLVE